MSTNSTSSFRFNLVNFRRINLRPKQLTGIDWLIGTWVVGMISVPVTLWTLGSDALPWAISINVVLLASAMIWILAKAWGKSALLRALMLILPLAWLLEFIGSTTGFPFGDYTYTGRFQPQLGHVPLIIPLAWLMMLPPAWAIAQIFMDALGNRRWNTLTRLLLFSLFSAIAFTAWDLFLDPQMVSWGVWHWAADGGYFGVPWQNFAGWLFGSFLLTLAVRPRRLPIARPLITYGITWFLQTIGLWLFWNMPGPAAVGFVTMGMIFCGALYLCVRSQPHAPHPHA